MLTQRFLNMQSQFPTKVIIDTDAGIGDALAILLALHSPELEVVGVTTVCGNVPVGQATINLLRILSLSKCPPLGYWWARARRDRWKRTS